MKSALSMMFGVAAVALVAAPLTSYAGGTISGKVTYSGKPEQKEFLFSKFPNPNFCVKIPNKAVVDGDKRFLKQIEVGKDGGLKGAIVAVSDIEDTAFMDGYAGTEVVAEFCDFQPFSGVVVNKRPFKVENKDADPDDPKSVAGVLHNPHSFTVKGATSATGFNIGLAKKGDTLEKPVVFRGGAEKTGYFRLQCDQHEFMQSFFLPVTNAHYAVAKDDGSFEIKDVPAGKHKVVVWHPFVGKGSRAEFDVDVTDGGTANLKAEVK
ncbi:MAG: carboxypeptidase regulatory-like domain-containing protein [Nitrospira sp.]|nr:carboxypeptidase regulatory-like domain-containing protein [Nitrospira sp.]